MHYELPLQYHTDGCSMIRRGTEQQREAGRKGMARWWQDLATVTPRCCAKSRTTGEPCERFVMENGRCHLHGGLTPKGDYWHKPKWPKVDTPRSRDKLERKLQDREREAKKRAARLAAMTPEQRARHEAWHKARKPGSAKARAAARLAREQNAQARAILSKGREQPSAFQRELEGYITALKERLRLVEGQDGNG